MELLYFSAHLELSESKTDWWTKAQVIGAGWIPGWNCVIFSVESGFKVNKSLLLGIYFIYLFIYGHDRLFKQEQFAQFPPRLFTADKSCISACPLKLEKTCHVYVVIYFEYCRMVHGFSISVGPQRPVNTQVQHFTSVRLLSLQCFVKWCHHRKHRYVKITAWADRSCVEYTFYIIATFSP